MPASAQLADELLGGGERRIGGLGAGEHVVVDDEGAERAGFLAADAVAPSGREAFGVVAAVDGDDVPRDGRHAGGDELVDERVEVGRVQRRIGRRRVAAGLQHRIAAADEVHVATHHATGRGAADLGGEDVVGAEHLEGDGSGQQLLVARRDQRGGVVDRVHRHAVDGDGDAAQRRDLVDDGLQLAAERRDRQVTLGERGHTAHRQHRDGR